ncbi:ATP-binding protein [Candidatus Woesearchaeota archaeon]|nr:ATP-binding protein [Candidatus Woesearchaeota archaeon]
MEKTFWDLIRLILPLSKARREHVSALKPYLSPEDLKYAKYLLKLNRIGVSYHSLNTRFAHEHSFPQLDKAVPEKSLTKTLNLWNDRIRSQAEEQAFRSFSERAAQVMPLVIAPHIVGMDAEKQAAAWQLFCPERVHLLLIGDPGTGKTEVLRGAAQFAPISSFGLGSGTSGAGLSAAKRGKELVKGLLPLAHKGLCCIDELNLMRPHDRGSLLNAMEKGFVTYDKGTTHQQLPAEVRVLATANPKGDRFVGDNISFLKEQLPFDSALLSRFHLVFFIRRPSKDEFLTITKRIVADKEEALTPDDVRFIKDYVAYAERQPVAFNKSLEPVITDFFDDLKSREDEYLVELSPRLVLGVVRLAKAAARMRLKEKVTHADLVQVLDVLKHSLLVAPDEVARKRKSRS